jgi:spermidine/putrescine transport system permease protein
MSSLYYTITIAIVSSVVATIIGTAAAIGIHRMGKKTKSLVLNYTF